MMYKFGVFFGKLFVFSFFIVIFICCAYAVPKISASSAILINADNGDVLFEQNANEKRGMASTTKIMTALLAIEHGNLDEEYVIPDEAIGVEGSSLYLKQGEMLSMRELIIGLMLQSANDAAEAIAIIISGDIDSFVELMNQKALSLGLSNTHFTNPHGLSDDDHYTTAKDLASLSAYALKNPLFKEICSTKKANIGNDDSTRYLSNHNKMLNIYDGACGVKTGFTKATGRCLVSAASRNSVNLIAVTLNAPDDWNDHSLMLDYGFETLESVTLVNRGDFICELPIIGGESDTVPVYTKNSLSVILKKSRNSIVMRIEMIYPKFAPVFKGDEVGRVVFFLDGVEIASTPLCIANHVKNKN